MGSTPGVVPAVVPVFVPVPALVSVVVPVLVVEPSVVVVVVTGTVALDAFFGDARLLSALTLFGALAFAPPLGADAFGTPAVFGAPLVLGANAFGAFEPVLATWLFTFGPLGPCAEAESAATTIANASATNIVTG